MDSCDNIRSERQGGYNVFVLSNGRNEPKGERKISSKLSKVLVESFLKRPSFKDVAFEKLTEMGNSAVLSAQTPNYRVQCEYLFLVLQGKKIRWSRNGDVTMLHFSNGELISRTESKPCQLLGDELEVEAELYDAEILDKKDHYLVAFTSAFQEKVSLQSIERCVRGADSAQDALDSLMQQYSQNGGDENVSVFTVHLPPRKKKSLWFVLIPVLIAVIFFVIGALGRMRPPM